MGVKYVDEFTFPSSAGFSGSQSDKIIGQPSSVPHFKRGGKVCKQKGGLTRAQDEKEDRKMVNQAINKHVRSPKPRGHGVGSFNPEPAIKSKK